MGVFRGLQVLEKWLLLIFFIHPVYLPHLPEYLHIPCLPEVWEAAYSPAWAAP